MLDGDGQLGHVAWRSVRPEQLAHDPVGSVARLLSRREQLGPHLPQRCVCGGVGGACIRMWILK